MPQNERDLIIEAEEIAKWDERGHGEWHGAAIRMAKAFLACRAQQSEGAQAKADALQPFIEALEAIDKDTPPDMMCEDAVPLEHALWTDQQPTVGELRALVEAFSLRQPDSDEHKP